ncbi:MAG: alpha/beta hydrolase [Acidobacteria bacterium]|nr:alpha/beta hydrolase [Acidobacteriota bacterium]MBI3424815.1 alpha/beta hydrolase [Acidobacteriota bacterium]
MTTFCPTTFCPTTFCLMHSSGQGPAGWQLLVDELERRGHRALTPAFRLDKTDEGLAFHAETIVQALNDAGHDPADVVCVAHSAAGMYLPLVVERWRPRRMVFLAALVPRPGLSVREQFQSDPTMFNPAWVGQNPNDDNVALEFVFHDCPPERLEWAMSTRVFFYAKRAMGEPCPLTAWPQVPASYIVCTEDRTITPAWQRKAAREWLGVEPIEIPGGHCPNVSRPELLADILDKLSMEG